VVRDLRSHLRLEAPADVVAFEQDLLAEFVLARSSAGIAHGTIRADVAAVEDLRGWLGRPLWTMTPRDADAYFGRHLREAMPGTRVRRAAAFAVYFEFLELRHKAEIHAATGFVVESPLDEVNRPRGGTASRLRIPPRRGRSPSCSPAGRTGWPAPASTARRCVTTPLSGWSA
jgi:hypothetical protein